jgi:hypothetical protein
MEGVETQLETRPKGWNLQVPREIGMMREGCRVPKPLGAL